MSILSKYKDSRSIFWKAKYTVFQGRRSHNEQTASKEGGIMAHRGHYGAKPVSRKRRHLHDVVAHGVTRAR